MTPSIPSETITKFFMPSVPVGWTKLTSGIDDSALRVTSGTVGTGGTSPFSSTFVSKTATGTRNIAVATSNTLSGAGSHSHATGSRQVSGSGPASGPTYSKPPTLPAPTQTILSWPTSATATTVTSSTGGDAGHTHTISAPGALNGPITGATVDFAVKYLDVILGQRN